MRNASEITAAGHRARVQLARVTGVPVPGARCSSSRAAERVTDCVVDVSLYSIESHLLDVPIRYLSRSKATIPTHGGRELDNTSL